MKILIVTSETLNPNDIFSSTFELSQAQILSSRYKVAILSVRDKGSASRFIKVAIRLILKLDIDGRLGSSLKNLLKSLSYLLFRQAKVTHYLIEGIDVYEGTSYSWTSTNSFSQNLTRWITSGRDAFTAYRKVFGLPSIIHAHGRFLNAGALAVSIKEKHSIPFIYTEHSTYYQRGEAPEASKPILKQVISEASSFIVVSPSLLSHVQAFLDQEIQNALVVPNVVDKIYEEPLAARPAGKNIVEFVAIATLYKKKGIDILLQAFQRAFGGDLKFNLKVVGDGPLLNELKKMTLELGIESQISFVGLKTKQEIRRILDDADIFVLPSRNETFGVVVIEALSRGLPIIATRCGGPEYILNDDCGILVETESVQKLAEALKVIIEDIDKYNRSNIRNYALRRYGATAFLEKMDEVYKSVRNQHK